jgi:hypothetical protein
METWQEYVRRVLSTAGDKQPQAQEKTGVHQTSIGRWLRGENVKKLAPGTVASFAMGYNENVLVAFVAARLLTIEQTQGMVEVLKDGTIVPAANPPQGPAVIEGSASPREPQENGHLVPDCDVE